MTDNHIHQNQTPIEKGHEPTQFKWLLISCMAMACLTAVYLSAVNAEQQAPRSGAPAPVGSQLVAASDTPGNAKKIAAPTPHRAVRAPAVVDAANAFLATLSPAQRAKVRIELSPQNAGRWSNFPAGFVPRNGVFFRDLNAKQVVAALKVAQLSLSDEGFKRFQEVRATDDYFAQHDTGPGGGGPSGGSRGGPGGRGGPPPGDFGGPDESGGFGGPRGGGPRGGGPRGGGPRGGGPGGFGGGGDLFGQGNYIIAFLGSPSKTAPWLLQLGGHHLAFNIFYRGKSGTATPYFVGAQPNVWKDAQNRTHAPLAPMRDALFGLLGSLSLQQQTSARLGQSFSDVYVGPGRDGQFPARSEGVAVSQLSTASKKWVKEAITAWTGDAAQGASYRQLYFAELGATKVAYSGTTTLNQGGDYVRIDGPHVWIEFSVQGGDHYHTIWRDRSTDYSAEFSFQNTKETTDFSNRAPF